MMPLRIFEGAFQHGELAFMPNVLRGVGAQTTLHEHEYPHVALFWPGKNGEARYRVVAIDSSGRDVDIPIDPWGFAYIAAKVRHSIHLIGGEEGKFVCLFAKHGPDGAVRADVFKNQPYSESC